MRRCANVNKETERAYEEIKQEMVIAVLAASTTDAKLPFCVQTVVIHSEMLHGLPNHAISDSVPPSH